ncbi:MAG: glucose-6-phosphate isomerase [Clostridia bacterium]|nr:MAG: glucose-6-phosphate isomerase [Clostridia bacterium]
MLWGKEIQLGEGGQLVFAEGISHPGPDVRRLTDMATVLYEPIPLDERPVYYMYRGVGHGADMELFAEHGLRYDLTVILPGLFGREYTKTVGHFHPAVPDSEDTYTEYYEVLSGEALYLLQKDSRSGDVEEIIAVAAKKGDKVFVPSGYGHVTVNPGEECLVMANLVESQFKSLYEPFRDKKGAAYYCVAGEKGKTEFIRNPNYHNSVGLKMMAAPSMAQPTEVVKSRGLYQAFVENPEAFKFLLGFGGAR